MLEQLKNHQSILRGIFFLLLFSGLFFINIPFLIPLIIAGIFALGLQDFISGMTRRTGIKRRWWVFFNLFAGLIIFFVPISLALYRIAAKVTNKENFESQRIYEQIHALKDFAVNGLQKVSDWTGTDLATPAQSALENMLQAIGSLFFKYSTSFVSELPAIFLAVLVFTIATAVMLFRDQNIKSFVMDYSVFETALTEKLIHIFKKSCSITLFSTFVIGLIQASIIGFGSLAMGEGDFWLVLTVTFFVSFIPVIGAAPVGYVLALLAFLGDRTGAAIGLMFIATIAGTIDNIIKPFMVSGAFKANAVMGFTCVVGAIIMLGLPGLLIGPVLMNLFVGISPLLLKNRDPKIKISN